MTAIWDSADDEDIWDALSQDSDYVPIFKFREPGDEIGKEDKLAPILGTPELAPLTEYNTDKPKLDRNGKQVMQVVLIVATDQCADDDHDGRWRLYLDKPLQKAAVLRALKDAGVRALADGGGLWLKYTHDRRVGGGSAKDFAAKYGPSPQQSSGPFGSAAGTETDTDSDDNPPF